jgi:hypothetical protein
MTLQEKLHHQKQMANAIQRQDEFYTIERTHITLEGDEFCTTEQKHIMLPTPQTCGTMTQQRTYAMDKAMDIIETFNK